MQPISIKRLDDGKNVIFKWNNGHESIFPLKLLRDICPCANCKGEDILLEHRPPSIETNHPRKYELIKITQVGSYAIQIEWGDGHNTGIYSWEYLYQNCPCEACSKSMNKINNSNYLRSEQ